MSDLFLGSMLVLVLLIPVLLRPFFRRLQRLDGLPVLPLIALLSCVAIVAGSGFNLSFVPVFFFVALVFLSGFSRLFRLFRGLPTDWFPPLSVVWHGFLLLVLVLTVFVSWRTRPELSWMPDSHATKTSFSGKVSPGVSARYTVWQPSEEITAKVGSRKVVLFTGTGMADSRETLAWILAEEGWTVVEASYGGAGDYRNPLLSVPALRDACILGGKILSGKPFFTDETEMSLSVSQNLARLVRFAHEEYGSFVPLYVVAEGSCVPPVTSFMEKNPEAFAGAACLLSAESASSFSADPAHPVLRAEIGGMMPSEAGSYPVLALSGDASYLYGFGELCADDILAASLLGGVRDSGRKQAELAGRRVATWLEMRRSFHEIK